MENRKIKICHVTTVDITAKFIILGFLKYLKKENYDVSIVCSPGKWTPLFREQGFLVHNIKMLRRISPFVDLVPLFKLFLYFRKEKFDIVHTYTPKAGVLGRIAARLAGIPIVIHTSFGFYVGIKIDPKVKRTILLAEKIAAYFCDLVISQNKEDIDFAINEKLVNAKKIKGLNYGINIQLFNPLKFSQDIISQKKNELHIPANKKVIGMVGRFVKEKGYLDLFKAFTMIKSKNPNVVLLLVTPPDKEKADALDYSLFKEYGIENDVVLLGDKGEITNIEEIYSLMDIFVLPSYREGLPYSIMEASASSKPVVTTNIRGCREAIEDGVTGILVPPENPVLLAKALLSLVDDPHKMVELGSNGRKKAEKEFDEKLAFARIEEEYDRLIAKKLK